MFERFRRISKPDSLLPPVTVTDSSLRGWIGANAGHVKKHLEDHRAELVRRMIPPQLSVTVEIYDPRTRTVSEMPLCTLNYALHHSLKLFSLGFEPVDGSVVLDRTVNSDLRKSREQIPGKPPYHHHSFSTDGSTIIDFTFGQFVARSMGPPGSSVEKLKVKAPELITTFPNGLSVLMGNITEIAEKLGIYYSPDAPEPRKEQDPVANP